jgi:subtilase family serine protease
MHVSKWSLCALLVTTVLSIPSFSATPDRIQGVIDSSQTVALGGSLHPKAQANYDQGPADPALPLHSIALATSPSPAQEQELNQLLLQLQDPKSPNYHKWLTPAQFGERFGLSQNDLNKIVGWLTSEGFVIERVGAGRNLVVFSGSAMLVQSAFKAEIHRYEVDGEEHFANSTPIMIPAALQGVVSGMIGVTDFRPRSASRARVMSRMQPDYYDGNFIFPNFLTPADIQTIYGIPSTLTGQGQSVAIMGQTDIFAADINDFRSAFGLSQISCKSATTGVISACSDPHFQYVLYGADTTQEPNSISAEDIGEADLDVEWSGAVAPLAQIVYVNAPDPSGNGVYDSLQSTLDPTSGTIPAHVVSMSYGDCEYGSASAIAFLEPVLRQGATEGVTVVNSSGDSGAAACDDLPPGGNTAAQPFTPAEYGYAVNYPASSWYVVAAGGASISLVDDSVPTVNGTYWGTLNGTSGTTTYGETAKGYIPEVPWNDNEEFASYCTTVSGASQSFCDPTFTSPAKGVAITSAAKAQEDYWISAGGGGASNCFTQNPTSLECAGGNAQPTWQSSLKLPTTPPGASGMRWVPDIAIHASPDFAGFIYCTPQNPNPPQPTYTSTCVNGIAGKTGAIEGFGSVVGGTSASSPIFAGILALLNQSLNTPSGSGLGDIHTTLYTIAAAANHGNGAFHPITTGDNMVYCNPGYPPGQPPTIQCPAGLSDGPIGYEASNADPTTGYNLVTGLGSVDVGNLATAWAAATQAQFSLSASSITPTTVAAGSSLTAVITVAPSSGSNFTVSFSCTSPPSGVSCSFSPTSISVSNGTATPTSTKVTISVAPNVAAGAVNVTVTGTSGGSATTTVGFTVTASNETFSFTSNLASGTLSVKQGATGNVNLTVTSTSTPSFIATSGGNTTTVLPLAYTCSGFPTLSTCTFSPVSPNQSTAVTVNIMTTPSSSAKAQPFGRGTRIFYAALLPGFFGIVLVAGSRRRSVVGMRMLGLILVLGSSTLWLGSCGGSNNSSTGTQGTPPGNYTITVNATTGGSAPITGSYQFTLTVTQ